MFVSLNKRSQGQLEFGIIYGGIALLALLAGRFLPLLAIAPSCAFHKLTGFPCPTCGSTRSIVHLSHGEFFSALTMNPLFAVCVLGAVLYLIYSLFTLAFDMPRIKVAFSEKERDWMRVSVVLLVLLNWAYLLLVAL